MPFQKYPEICPVCRQGRNFKFIRDFESKQGRFSLYECCECQIHFWLPFRAPSLDWYKENTFRIKSIIKPEVYRGYHKKFFKINKNFIKGTKVLDLGCGAGEFLHELEKKGCEVWGADLDEENIKIAKDNFGLKNVFSLVFDDFFKMENLPKFDIITFFETFEYLDDPLKFIQNVKRLLKEDGKIILSVPYRGRMLANLNHWDFPPHHLTRWNEWAISNLFNKCGFKINNIFYVEEFKILLESVVGKFKTGLAGKSLSESKNRHKFLFFVKIIYFLGRSKDYLIGAVPALFLLLYGKILKRKNGIMLIELKHE
ncbi:MAG: class I SAM-dependent methyltransferase [Patescibacteria group bacterium]